MSVQLYRVIHPVKDIEVADLDATCKFIMETDSEITADIATMPWGERIFYAKDPFGNPIAFVDQTTLFTGSRD